MDTAIDPEQVVITEMVDGQKVHLMYVQTWDGLYAPIGVDTVLGTVDEKGDPFHGARPYRVISAL